MSDSVDRVFSHALNTVNKIRTGSQKPPSATRLRLYGLYKQAMEGDVDGIMERPSGPDEQSQRAREKWDAWKQQNDLSRTEAKRRYITTLIDTMHKYASPSPDSRELVAELEFVWDQVKSNVPSSSSSSPLRTPQQHKPGYSTHDLGQSGRAAMGMGDSNTMGQSARRNTQDEEDAEPQLAMKTPMSEADEALEAEPDREVFVDAPDSQYQYNPAEDDDNDSNSPRTNRKKDTGNLQDTAIQTDLQNLTRAEPIPIQTPTPAPRNRALAALGKPIAMNFGSTSAVPPSNNNNPPPNPTDTKWRKRVEQALQKQTAEVAALREQLEARRLFSHSPHYRFFRGVWRWIVAAVKHVAVDVFILGVVLLYLRRKRDTRLEGAIRVLLGDAVARVGGVGGLGKMRMPRLGGGGKKTGG